MDLSSNRQNFDKILEHFKKEVAGIRTGRATSSLVDELTVEYYGGKYQLRELATISIPEPKSILIQPWDKGALGAIEKAIKQSALGLQPVNDGQVLRLVLPALTRERREEFVKLLGKKKEEARIAVRQERGEIWENIQRLEKEGKIRENEKFKAKGDLQKIIDDYNNRIEKIAQEKEKELMT